MHPSTTPRRVRQQVLPWFGNLLHWTPPHKPRWHFPMRITHYAGRTHELVKFSFAQAQQLDLHTNGWHFAAHPHVQVPGNGAGFGPALHHMIGDALMLAEAWLLSPNADVLPDPEQAVPDLLLVLSGCGPAFQVRGRIMQMWPDHARGRITLHRYREHLSERGPELGTLTPHFDRADYPATERHGLRWRPTLSPALGGDHLESSLYWREAAYRLADTAMARRPR